MEILYLNKERRSEVIDVLVTAFYEYPVMHYVIGKDKSYYDEHLRHLVGFYADVRFQNDWPVLGIEREGELAAVALISEPGKETVDVSEQLRKVKQEMGEEAFERMEKFEEASDKNEPEGSHHFLGMLGVKPKHQGLGMGRLLLVEAKKISKGAGTRGVCLSTEDPKNVPYYQSLGFQILGQIEVDEMTTWCLFNENSDL